MVKKRGRGVWVVLLVVLGISRVEAAEEPLDPATAKAGQTGDVLFYDVRPLGVEGQGWSEVEAPFDRLPATAKDVVRAAVWKLARHSAGLCVRFATDATTIHARWTLTDPDLAMRHMPATGVSGVDLYVKAGDGAAARWRWLAV